MLTLNVYPFIFWLILGAFFVLGTGLLLRLIFNYADPNPFGKIGRLSYHLKRRTDRFVYPSARFLAGYRIDTRLAPLMSLLIAGVLTYFLIQIIGNALFVIDGLTLGVSSGKPKLFIGFVLYGLLSVVAMFIFIRMLASWFVYSRNTFLGFVQRVTDPILNPLRQLIPPLGVFDISAMILLIVIWLLQSLVMKTLILS